MPSSFPDALGVVLPFVIDLAPRSILDVGVGFGKYGFLFREYLDVITREGEAQPFAREGRRVRIDGIEAHPAYVTDLQRAVYDTIHVGDALALLPGLDPHDLVFAADVLEHFSPADGRRFLAECRRCATRGVLVVTPALQIPQGPAFGNVWETHRSVWAAADFAGWAGADVLMWRRQLVAWLPTGGDRRRLPRPTLREAGGLAVRAGLAALLGPVQSEVLLERLRRRRLRRRR